MDVLRWSGLLSVLHAVSVCIAELQSITRDRYAKIWRVMFKRYRADRNASFGACCRRSLLTVVSLKIQSRLLDVGSCIATPQDSSFAATHW